MYDIYKIKIEDNLNTIAKMYNTTPEVLRNLNRASTFIPGENIIVPTENEYFEIYTIQKGDSLYEIARLYNTDYNLLALLNGLNINDYIYPNQKVLVPKKDVKYYLTKDNDTLFSVANTLKANLNKLLNQNKTIYLKEGQLIVYKD